MQERGELEGKDLVEPTSGNTGIALAALAALMNFSVLSSIGSSALRDSEGIFSGVEPGWGTTYTEG